MEKLDSAVMEEQILLLLDGELSPKQEKIVWQQIELFSEYRALYEEYKQVYLVPEELEIPTYNHNALLKDESGFVAMSRFKLAPIWGIAAGLALVLGITYYLQQADQNTDKVLVKSDRINEVLQSNLPPHFRDSINAKKPVPKGNTNSKKTTVEAKVQQQSNPQLVLNDAGDLPQKRKEMPVLAQHKLQSLPLLVNQNKVGKIPNFDATEPAKFDALAIDNSENDQFEPKGLLSDMVKAGQWIFGEKRQEKTIEIAIGDNEKRTIKFKL